jgi:L-lactate dehydrogenase complex protein LldG
MSARDDVLARVRSALRQAPDHAAQAADLGFGADDPEGGTVAAPQLRPAGDPVVPAEPAHQGERVDVVALFGERVADYRAVVVRCAAAEVAEAVRVGLADSVRVVVPTGFPEHWLPALPDRVTDEPVLAAAELDHVDAVVTTAALGIALTGTIVLDHGPGQGRRALSLVPDRHVCVVRADQVVADVPDAVRALEPTRPMTWVSGPSATSDIELDRVEGVHGPRTLHVVLVDPA